MCKYMQQMATDLLWNTLPWQVLAANWMFLQDPEIAKQLGERWQDAIMDLCDNELLFAQAWYSRLCACPCLSWHLPRHEVLAQDMVLFVMTMQESGRCSILSLYYTTAFPISQKITFSFSCPQP